MGCPIPSDTNPAEYLLEQLNMDFIANPQGLSAHRRLTELQSAWTASYEAHELERAIDVAASRPSPLTSTKPSKTSFFPLLLTLMHRSFIKSYRDVVAYQIRIAMYMGLAIMMGTVWLRLMPVQDAIQPFINAIVSNNQSNHSKFSRLI